MKSHTILSISIFILLAIIISACNLPSSGVNTQEPGLTATQPLETTVNQPTALPNVNPTVVITPAATTPTTVIIPTSTPTTEPSATPTTAASETPVACTNQAEFVSDVTIPDNTELLTGQEFIKTWRLKNSGTCTWTNQYALLFDAGDLMNGTSPLPLSSSIAPGDSVDLSVTFKAPGTTGTYRSDWKLQDTDGNTFGLGKNFDQSFYVQIKVVEGLGGLNLGNPTWRDTLDNTDYWYLLDTANTKWTEGDGVLILKSIHPGESEEWGLANQPSLEDYYLQATFIVGENCSGLDRYGLLGRSPDPNQGYVFEFTCDGHYRLYTWDGEHYDALQEWRTAASIKTGPGQTNVMGLWMEGDTIKLYANDFKIGEFKDSMFDKGQFGLVIGTVNTDNFTVSVDQVEYWKLNP